MTLSLTLATPQYVLQATDRLVSDAVTGRPFDRVSNKNVVYQARDAILTIAYSGTAYIKRRRSDRGRPTDQWIAELLTGETFFEDGQRWAHRSGEIRQWLDAETCVARLRESMTKPYVSSPEIPFSVVVAGWQWTTDRTRARPILVALSSGGGEVDEKRLFRYWHRVPWPESAQPTFPCSSNVQLPPHFLNATPASNYSVDRARETRKRMYGCLYSPKAALDELVQAIRRRSHEVSGIGKDCIGIYLPHPADPRVQIAYRPVRDYGLLMLDGMEVGPPDYSPWIVGRNHVQAPSLAVGGAPRIWLDDFEVEQHLRPFSPRKLPSGARVLSVQTYQRRPPSPGTR